MPLSLLDYTSPSPKFNPTGALSIPPSQPAIQPAVQAAAPKKEKKPQPDFREFGDSTATRRLIFDNVLSAAKSIKPLENTRHRLELQNVEYAGPEQYSIAERKKALLEGRTLSRRLRGSWVLYDKNSGDELDRRDMTVANVPYLTDGGTFVHNGSEYVVGQQLRLRPGIFTRVKDNGEIESHINILPGKGRSHRYFLDPEKGVFYATVGQAKIPLAGLMRVMGATDQQLRDAWGANLFATNARLDTDANIDKFYDRFVRRKPEGADRQTKLQLLRETIENMEIDPEVSRKTLGYPHENLTLDAMLDTTRKLLAVSRGEKDIDDRDHLAYQTVHGPEDFFAERLEKDYGNARRTAFNRASWQGNLGKFNPGMLTKQLESALIHSGLGINIEETNPSDVFDKQYRITRLGEGGIGSADAIPTEARAVQPSHLAFIDSIRTPESFRAGVDLYLASASRKGRDGKIYSPFTNTKTGETVWKSPQDVADLAIAFPGEMSRESKRVFAMQGGRIRPVPKEEVDLILPDFEGAFSPLGNLIPLKSMVKGQRMAMGSRMLSQALPLSKPESPLVQAGSPSGESYEKLYGEHMGALRAARPGRVMSVDDHSIKVKYADGTTEQRELYHHYPYNRRTFWHQTPTVRPGDTFQEGDLLARSNYTDENGVTALGKNVRTAYMPFRGMNFEDAVVVSQSLANKLSSEHMYQHRVDFDKTHKRSKSDFISIFPGKYDRKQLETIGGNGAAREGTRVEFGDPLILAAGPRAPGKHRIHRKKARTFSDQSVTWNHHAPGVVTDVIEGKSGTSVLVKSIMPMQQADKLCYDDKTEVLTRDGWKPIASVTLQDKIASLNTYGGIEYVRPARLHNYRHDGRMYSLETTQVSLCVTDNHHLYARKRREDSYSLIEARDLYGKWYKLLRNGRWKGKDPETISLSGLAVKAGQSGNGTREMPAKAIPARTYAMLLGMFLSEGNVFDAGSKGKGFDIAQIKEPNRSKALAAMEAAGISYCEGSKKSSIRVYSVQWYSHFRQFGKCNQKYIPEFVFDWSPKLLSVLYEWLSGGSRTQSARSYHTTSKRLADDVQRLALHLGMSANVDVDPPRTGMIKGAEYDFRARYRVSIYRSKNMPTINSSHVKSQGGQQETWQEYHGNVYCVTLPRNHVLYVRRNGKPVWCGNSGLYGDKGVVSKIVPDEEMPHDRDGKPFELLLNPLGVISRGNPGQVVAAVLGKIAEKRGKPYVVPDFTDVEDMTRWAINEADKHDVKVLEDVIDPETGRKIPGILTGNRYMLKLHHLAESKGQGRSTGGYTQEDLPARGGETGSKRISLMDSTAILSHGATGVLRDASTIRGQRNEDFWLAFMQGYTPPKPKVPIVFQKFVNELKASGVNVVPDGAQMHIMALTDNDIDKMAGNREIKNGETVDFSKGLEPVTGGLFDPKLTGGHQGNKWSFVKLTEPMPSPVMEEPIRRILGLTQKKFENVLACRDNLGGGECGPQGIQDALGRINLKRELLKARVEIKGSRKGKRDEAVRRLGYLKAADRLGIHPKEWMLNKVPVLPPMFRPVSVIEESNIPLVADPNFLYKELIDANNLLADMKEEVDDVGEERLSVYNAFKAVTGLGNPVHPKLQEKRVKGILKHIFGSSPKLSAVQRKLLSSPVDLVGRAVITPNPDLDIDHVGLPETRAWEVYKNFIVRRLKRRGMPLLEAMRHAKERTPLAREELMKELEHRPVYISRAPVLHKFGVMAFWPRLTKGDSLQISPLVVGGFGADFDGDAMSYHVPVDEEARQQAIDLMMPSANLLSPADFKSPMHKPSQEYVGGLYEATKPVAKKKSPRYFASEADAIKAYHRGDVSIDTPVRIRE